jgi:hypothetical protein
VKKEKKTPHDGNSNLTNERIKLANSSLIFSSIIRWVSNKEGIFFKNQPLEANLILWCLPLKTIMLQCIYITNI